MNWRTTNQFPAVSADGWQAKSGSLSRIITGQSAVEKAIFWWHPLHPLLVAVPGAERLLPPLAIEQLKEKTHKSFLLRSRLSIEFASLCAALALLPNCTLSASDGPQIAFLLFGLVAFLLADYWFVLRRLDAITERSMFNFGVRETARVDLALWGGAMLVVGALQFVAESRLGGFQPLVEKYGVSFQALAHGEFWRLLSGPLIHLDFAHWATNAFLVIFIAMVAAKISRIQAVAVFLFGSAVGALTTWAAVNEPINSYVGVSAGVMAMLGLCAGAAWRAPGKFPIKFAFTLITFGLLNIYLAWIYTPEAANAAHSAGLFVGVIWGVLFQDRQIRQTFRFDSPTEAPSSAV